MYLFHFKQDHGMSTLIAVIIVTSIMLLMLVGMSSISSSALQARSYHTKAFEIFAAAETCMEEALLQLKNNELYSGGMLQRNDAACIVTVTSSGDSHTIRVKASAPAAALARYTRELEAVVQRNNGSLKIGRWYELTD